MLVCGRHSWYFYFSRFIPMSRSEFMKLETSKENKTIYSMIWKSL